VSPSTSEAAPVFHSVTRRVFHRRPRLAHRAARRLSAASEFISVEALSGVALLLATVAALAWANLAEGSYADVWDAHLTIGVGDLSVSEDLRHWVNDGLMTVFFFVVGLEIKRELVCGELRDPRNASLPVLGAIGGMIVPAGIYTAVNAGGAGADGWAIPMATDIAFAVAVLGVLGSRVPSGLKLFVLTLAVVDDIGAILVIALFYTDDFDAAWLLGAVVVLGLVVLMRRVGVTRPLGYLLPALLLWLFVFESGIHATIAGVVLGLLTPARPVHGRPVIEQLEHDLHPWSSFLIVPVFALSNAGVLIDSNVLDHATTGKITWGIMLGLVVGKPLGIALASAIGLRTRLSRLPSEVGRAHILGGGMLAGIGFTVSLFIAGLAFEGTQLDEAKLGILAASIVSAALGTVVLLGLSRRSRAQTHSST
jgi:Na+:H+ antiporter, NhaA family